MEDVEDIVQEVFLSALHNHPDREGVDAGYLYQAVRNRVRNLHRDRARRASALTRFAADREGLLGGRSDAQSDLDVHALQVAIATAAADLPLVLREAWELRAIAGLQYREIAARLGVSTSAAVVRVHRARAALREILEGTRRRAEE